MRKRWLLSVAAPLLALALAGCGGALISAFLGLLAAGEVVGRVDDLISEGTPTQVSVLFDGQVLPVTPAANGTLRLTSLPEGAHLLQLVAPSRQRGSISLITVPANGQVNLGTQVVYVGGRITGTVTAEGSGGGSSLVPRLLVLAIPGGAQSIDSTHTQPIALPPTTTYYAGYTDGSGRFSLDAVAPGAYLVTAALPGQGADVALVADLRGGQTIDASLQLPYDQQGGYGTVKGSVLGALAGGGTQSQSGAALTARPTSPFAPPVPDALAQEIAQASGVGLMSSPWFSWEALATLSDPGGATSCAAPPAPPASIVSPTASDRRTRTSPWRRACQPRSTSPLRLRGERGHRGAPVGPHPRGALARSAMSGEPGHIFGARVRRRYNMLLGLATFGSAALPFGIGLVVVELFWPDGTGTGPALTAVAALALAMAGPWVVHNRLALAGNQRLRRQLWERLTSEGLHFPEGITPVFVGFAPSDRPMTWWGDTDRDIGFLGAWGDSLVYLGDEFNWHLSREAIDRIEPLRPVAGLSRIAIRWHAPRAGGRSVTLVSREAPDLRGAQRATGGLFQQLLAWVARPATAGEEAPMLGLPPTDTTDGLAIDRTPGGSCAALLSLVAVTVLAAWQVGEPLVDAHKSYHAILAAGGISVLGATAINTALRVLQWAEDADRAAGQ